MKQEKTEPLNAADFIVPEGARQSLASFGVTDESDQDTFFRELADGLKRAADVERAIGLRGDPDGSLG